MEKIVKTIKRWWHWRQLRRLHCSADKALRRVNRQHQKMRRALSRAGRHIRRAEQMLS